MNEIGFKHEKNY